MEAELDAIVVDASVELLSEELTALRFKVDGSRSSLLLACSEKRPSLFNLARIERPLLP